MHRLVSPSFVISPLVAVIAARSRSGSMGRTSGSDGSSSSPLTAPRGSGSTSGGYSTGGGRGAEAARRARAAGRAGVRTAVNALRVGRVKYLAGSGLGAGVFTVDALPEAMAPDLRAASADGRD